MNSGAFSSSLSVKDVIGVPLTSEADDADTELASLMTVDPDGNPILIDQHVPRPA